MNDELKQLLEILTSALIDDMASDDEETGAEAIAKYLFFLDSLTNQHIG